MNIEIVRVLCGLIQENAYIVAVPGRDDCVVVDPGDEYPKLKRALGERRVGAILLTHGHFDHIMAAGPLAAAYGAPVYVSAADMEMLNDAAINGYTGLMGGGTCWPRIGAAPYAGGALSVCGLDFTILSTPGHSRGSVCLYLPDAAALFSGDTLFCAGYGRLDLHGGNLADMLSSLKALFALPADTAVYPGHGGNTTIGKERVRYRL
ncbi:MAG: MBL fold metallo-hydrolase [Clostridia bacterium]|nr:MBL fold metallo-hydrolase [Clostridia bacterium]